MIELIDEILSIKYNWQIDCSCCNEVTFGNRDSFSERIRASNKPWKLQFYSQEKKLSTQALIPSRMIGTSLIRLLPLQKISEDLDLQEKSGTLVMWGPCISVHYVYSHIEAKDIYKVKWEDFYMQ